MTDAEIQDFVTRFAAAWAARDGNAFLDLWHPEGTLNTPMVGRTVKGSELNRLMEVQKAAAPDFVWQLLDWTSRGDVVIVEWQTTRIVNGARFDWRGSTNFASRPARSSRNRCIATPLRCAPCAPAKRWSRLRNSENADHAAGCVAVSSLASRWTSALLIAACRVGAVIWAPSRSVT
jgi:hypothetical protein